MAWPAISVGGIAQGVESNDRGSVMTSLSRVARQDRRWSSDLPDRLQKALDGYDFASAPEFESLSGLSSRTELEFVRAHGESAVIEGDHWRAPVTIYVILNYGGKSDPVSMNDSYPGVVIFGVDAESRVAIDHIEADVTSFYGEEADIS